MNVIEPFLRMARQQPAAPAISAAGQTKSYGELLAHAGALAQAFLADGVKPGQRVAVVGGPAVRVLSTLALAWIGAVSADTGALPDDKLTEIADELELDALYSRRIIDLKGAKTRIGNLDPLMESLRGSAPPPVWAPAPDDMWRIAISSGTTGRPKGVTYSHRSSIVNVHLVRTIYPAGPGDSVVLAMNAAMSYALHNWLRCLYTGASAVLAENLRPAELLQLLQGDGVTHCMTTPAAATVLAKECTEGRLPAAAPGKRLHTFSVGGGRVSAGVRETLRARLCDNVIVHYGGAEMQLVAVLDPKLAEARPACSGRVLPWIEVEAVGPDGAVLPVGETGRLRFRAPVLASGYVGSGDKAAFQDGWFLSEDRGMVTPDGLVFLRGRANDVINLGGRKLDPEAMEEVILADRNIVECAVVDVPGPLASELVAVIVDPSRSANVEALVKRCRDAVPGLSPKHVLHTDKLPRNESGKIMRGAVRRSVLEMMKERKDA